MLSLFQELQERWLLKHYTDEKLFDLYDKGGQKFYFWMDPTADSLHLGNFVNFMNAVHLMRRWNICIPLVGGATGMIGDPGGKDSERSFLDDETLSHNTQAIQQQIFWLINNMRTVLWEDLQSEKVFDNKTFYIDTNFLDFLRDIGKYITVNSMMSRETVKKRLTEADKSISYTEFSYMLIQWNDFYRLFCEKDCKLQIAGSDQRGNITIGTELIRKKLNKTAYGFTCPLILDSTGKKFGKSEWNALFLDPSKTTPTQLYQYFINIHDNDVERYLKLFTFYTFDEIKEIITIHQENPSDRYGQKKLAEYIVTLIAGKTAADQATVITSILFSSWDILELIKLLSQEDIDALVHETGGNTCSNLQNSQEIFLKDIITQSWLATSNKDLKQLIQSGAIFFNEKKVDDINHQLLESDIINGVVVLRKGKKGYKIVRVG